MLEISWSRARAWRRCHKLHDYHYNQRLQRKKPKPPMLKGSILHEMLDARATGGNPASVLEKYAKEYRALFVEERELYGDIINDLSRVFEGYERQYEKDSFKVVTSESFIATNLTPRIRFIGYIDKILSDASGRLWLSDHKTGKNIPSEDARFSDLQLLFYVWAWNQEKPSQRISGVVWDYLRTKPPTIPELLKNGSLTRRANIDTDHTTYMKAIEDAHLDPKDYIEELTRLDEQVSPFFRRVQLPNPPKAMVDSVVNDLITTAREIEHLGEISTTRTMVRDCSSCIYFVLCHAELRGQDSDFVRKSEFTIKEPSHHGEESEDTAE